MGAWEINNGSLDRKGFRTARTLGPHLPFRLRENLWADGLRQKNSRLFSPSNADENLASLALEIFWTKEREEH